jgi:hypothetical protein
MASPVPTTTPTSRGEYPAVPVDDWGPLRLVDNAFVRSYNISVEIGMKELYRHLNDRYAGNGPRDNGACSNETLVLAGYSQGADVVGWTLQRSELSQAAKDHIGYVALYGDPKFNPGSRDDRVNRTNFQSNWWWVRGDDTGYRYINSWPLPDYTVRNSGILGARSPYVSGEFKRRLGSWCAYRDGICSGILPNGMDVHTSSYTNYWMPQSAVEIAYVAKRKHDQLNGSGGSGSVNYLTLPPTSGPPIRYDTDPNPEAPPPPPMVTHIKRTTGPDGVREVYASTMSSVTEAWWYPGGDGVHTDEMIHISQNNIVGFDKVNEPDGVTQSLYTAVPDGVWETWWRPGDGSHSNKIVTGLTGVRQVIAAPEVESAGYTHRLYILASDGPYEAWWREGGDGVHLTRLNNISGPVTMTKSTGPSGEDQLYVATPTWVYELWWHPGQGVHYGSIINITQGDIRSLSKGANLSDGGQLLYTGTSTTAWQTYWNSSTAPSHGTIATGQAGAIQIEKDVWGGVHELYLATGDHVQEYWWNGPNSGGGELIRISQNNITSFDKSDDGADQQVYTASGDLVYETWWRAGVSPTSHMLFKVGR